MRACVDAFARESCVYAVSVCACACARACTYQNASYGVSMAAAVIAEQAATAHQLLHCTPRVRYLLRTHSAH